MSNPYAIEIAAGETDGPVVIVGELTFTDPDNQPGAATPVATLVGSIVAAGIGAAEQYAPINPAGRSALTLQGPPGLVTAASSVCNVPTVTVANVPDLDDEIDFIGTLLVTDQTGTNTLLVGANGSAPTPIDGAGATLDWTGSTAQITGDDLSWDDLTGVTSAAGGVYSATLLANTTPD